MLFTLVATLCYVPPGPSICIEEIVAHVPYQVCTISGQKLIAPWMESGKYSQDWRLDNYRCEGPEYVVREHI